LTEHQGLLVLLRRDLSLSVRIRAAKQMAVAIALSKRAPIIDEDENVSA
jgi:hypothetical protein